MAHIAVVYHSGYGHTQRLAQAVAEGAGAQLVAIDAEGNLPEGTLIFPDLSAAVDHLLARETKEKK